MTDEAPTTGLDRADVMRLGGLLAALLVLVAVVLLASGGGSDRPQTGRLTGILTSVSPDELVLQPDGGGAPQTFAIRPEDRERLDLLHLQQHASGQLPSIVHFERDGDRLFAVRVDDAPPG